MESFNPLSILGILVLLAPAVFIAWRSSRKKKIDIKSGACLPVVDPNAPPKERI